MSFTLQEVVFQTRSKLGEQLPNYWFQNELILDINQLVQEMCSEAQCLETVIQIAWPGQQQEYALPVSLETVLDVAVFSGQLFQLTALDDFSDVQIANRVTGIPQAFYTKVNTTMLSPQSTTDGNIAITNLPQNPMHLADAITVLGLWPSPAGTTPTTVWGTRFHPFVKNPQDPINIPRRFFNALVAGAVANGKEKEGFLDDANYYSEKYMAGRQEHTNYWIGRRQLKTAPSYGGSSWPTLARGSSSVIFLDQSPQLYNQ